MDSPSTELPTLRACGVLVFRSDPEDSFLLMRHHDRWDLPKGHVDPGESDQECALRELHEETGIRPQLVALDSAFQFTTRYEVATRRVPGGRADKTVVIFLGRLLQPVEIRVTEHPGFAWFPWSPPHRIQRRTIDPLLEAVAEHRRQ